MTTTAPYFPSFPKPTHEGNIPGRDLKERVDVECVTTPPPSQTITPKIQPSTLDALLFSLSRFLDRTIQEPYKRHIRKRKSQDEYLQTLYGSFRERGIEEYPEGWPQFAAFLNSADNFAIFRRFGLVHCRVLVHLQAEIQLLEQQLSELDNIYSEPGASNPWRLQTAEYDDSWDPTQKEILKQLQDKLVVYGQYNWIYHAADFIPHSKVPHFESVIFTYVVGPLLNLSEASSIVRHYPLRRISAFAKLATVSITVAALVPPIYALLWTSMSQVLRIATAFLSVVGFSGIMSLTTTLEFGHILIGAATYSAVVLATFLGSGPGMDNVQATGKQEVLTKALEINPS